MQSPARAILIAGQMVASSQIDAQIGIILTIGTSIGGLNKQPKGFQDFFP